MSEPIILHMRGPVRAWVSMQWIWLRIRLGWKPPWLSVIDPGVIVVPYGDSPPHYHYWGPWQVMGDGRTEIRQCQTPGCSYYESRRAR